ncbi:MULTISPECIES: hypothetical protein [unclassified Coleofasciculus]|uniref:hypothetical protein n=1 Tax=unclassified Coleofasciculus TaxID=2692782 RepID=UPI0018830EDE|nr:MULTISPECIES: hypothetical protein [unclassified Coleofasciculus]MBE9126862.1 hypothetical protein [Coleofasciculus sp. LEGE 07081]MBE9150227.1 hypothetical protein [Coleofasciculus sp. LEGE 07092]
MNVVSNLFSFFIAMISNFGTPQSFTPPSSYQPLEVIDGAGFYKQQLTDSNTAYLQVIDLQKMQIDQLVGEVDNMGLEQGKYYQGEARYYSPFFKNKLFEEVTNEYQELYGGAVFSIINCSFFEQYQSSTQLSFPIKLNSEVITAGNSPYGPIDQPKDKFYRTIRLKALVWDDKQAYIADYDPATGAPLNETDVKNAIVTYQYSDHPAKVLAQNPENKYHVIGTLDFDGNIGDELLLIMTVNKATLDKAADLLRQLGVKGEIITIDGGSSTYLFNSRMGKIVLPQLANQNDSPTFPNLPHYLGFHQRGKTSISPQIKVSQPAGKVQVEENQPYLILWRDNLDDEVAIELYEGNKPIQDISPRTASDGVYEWTPDKSVKEGDSIRISSLKNRKIFGTLPLP